MKRLSIYFIVLGLLGLIVASMNVTQQTLVQPMKFSESDYYWMAKNVYHEAGNQGVDGYLAVMQVTMNRVGASGYPSTIKEVVTQKNSRGCQFSWYCMKRLPYNEEKFMETYKYVKAVLPFLHVIHDTTEGAVYYHATYVKPYWAKVKEKTVVIGDHIFYREKSKE